MGISRKWSAVAALGVLVLALVLFGSSATQAEKGATWLVNGTKLGATSVGVQEVEGKELPLRALFAVFSTVTEFRCSNLELINFVLLPEGSGSGKVRFTGCKFFVKGMEISACAPELEGKVGVIETLKLKALIVLHKLESGSTDPLVRIEPSEGELLAHIGKSKECSASSGSFGGVVYLKDSAGKLTVEQLTHLVEPGPLTNVFFDVKGSSAATLDGSALLGLIAEHQGRQWSAFPS